LAEAEAVGKVTLQVLAAVAVVAKVILQVPVAPHNSLLVSVEV
jgi:hypothetical protein